MKHSVKNFLKLHSLFNIYLFILIPILILVVSECISFVFNFYSYKNLLTKNYASRLETLHDENMALLQNITSFAYSLSGNDDFMEYLALSDPVPIEDLRLKNQVKLLSNSHSFIDSMAIIKRVDDGFVYASDTIYPLSEYCSTVCNYADYPAEYWLSYTSPIQGVDFLPPTDVLNEEGEKYIYPIVYSKIGSKSLGTGCR